MTRTEMMNRCVDLVLQARRFSHAAASAGQKQEAVDWDNVEARLLDARDIMLTQHCAEGSVRPRLPLHSDVVFLREAAE